jgi:hypothetical protein
MVTARRARKQPVQARSRETEARLLAATESLLAEREFETISIDEIVARTHLGRGVLQALRQQARLAEGVAGATADSAEWARAA